MFAEIARASDSAARPAEAQSKTVAGHVRIRLIFRVTSTVQRGALSADGPGAYMGGPSRNEGIRHCHRHHGIGASVVEKIFALVTHQALRESGAGRSHLGNVLYTVILERSSGGFPIVSGSRVWIRRLTFLSLVLAALPSLSTPQSLHPKFYSEMRWRAIGPPRAGRARAVAGSPSHPNVAYIGFDNGGIVRSTDYGSTWTPIFDNESTGSIGAIAVAPSDANTIYVGTGAGIIRPDLATGDGMYKSTDGGKTWAHLGLRDSQMIANIDVDPRNANRLFVAVLGQPDAPNPERGIFRSTDGGATFDKVLFKDEYTSGHDVRIDPKDPNIVYAALCQQQQGFMENGAFSGPAGGIFKSTDGGNNWRPLTLGLPAVTQANPTVSSSNPKVVYAMAASAQAAGANPAPAAGGRGGPGRGRV